MGEQHGPRVGSAQPCAIFDSVISGLVARAEWGWHVVPGVAVR